MPSVLAIDRIVIVSSFALSSRRASERVGLLIVEIVRHWQKVPTVRWIQCLQHVFDCWWSGGRAPSGHDDFGFGGCVISGSLS